MLQVNVKPLASDCLEEAMKLAQIKALNSFDYSDCLNYINYAWSDIYSRMACIDDGYYARTVKITQKKTLLPPYVKNSVLVYKSREATGSPSIILRRSGYDDMDSTDTYHISGAELYVPAAEYGNIWLRYVPACPQLFFTHHNRDPKLHDEYEEKRNKFYGLYYIAGRNTYIKAEEYSTELQYFEYDYVVHDWKDVTGQVDDTNFMKYYNKTADEDIITIDPADLEADLSLITQWVLVSRADNIAYTDITQYVFGQGPNWEIKYVSCDFPYIFVSYQHKITGDYLTGFFDRDLYFNQWNGMDFIGRGTNCLLVSAMHNDKTGMGVVVKDYNDLDEEGNPRIKELGWTPDTMLDYPCPEMYRYLVARLADKFSALNESDVLGVQKELAEARYAFEAYLEKDKSAWKRINNVNPATIADYL